MTMWHESRTPIACRNYNLHNTIMFTNTIIIRFRAPDACLLLVAQRWGGGLFGLIGGQAPFRNGSLIYFYLRHKQWNVIEQ